MFKSANLVRRTSLVLTLAAAALAGAPIAAHAATPDDTATHTAYVSTAGLDLTTPNGVAALQHRTTLAAERVCRMEDGNMSDVDGDDFAGCVSRIDRTQRPWIARRVADAQTAFFAQRGRATVGSSFQSASSR